MCRGIFYLKRPVILQTSCGYTALVEGGIQGSGRHMENYKKEQHLSQLRSCGCATAVPVITECLSPFSKNFDYF